MAANDTIPFNLRNASLIVSLALAVGGAIAAAASSHTRITTETEATKSRQEAFDERLKSLEGKMQWQNDVLWEIRGDIKELRVKADRSAKSP